jgi:hypothetical protein
MEARFGHEFGDVRVHTDEHAAALKLRLHDEMFVEYSLQPGQQMTLPYPNIRPRS